MQLMKLEPSPNAASMCGYNLRKGLTMRLACVSASLRMIAARRSLAAASSSMRRSRFSCSAALALTCSSCTPTERLEIRLNTSQYMQHPAGHGPLSAQM